MILAKINEFKGTVYVITPFYKSGIPDSQSYHLNLYLGKNVKEYRCFPILNSVQFCKLRSLSLLHKIHKALLKRNHDYKKEQQLDNLSF